MFGKGGVHFATFCVIVAAFASCGDSKSTVTEVSHGPAHVDSVGGVLDLAAAPYNAVPGVDAYPALQAAVNDSCAQSAWPSVRIPLGTFPLSQTVVISCGVDLFGASRHGTVLHPTFNGPALLLESSPISLATGPALVGTGVSFTEARPPPNTIVLSDVPVVKLNGLSAFTAEGTFSFNSYTATDGYDAIVTSQGVIGSGGPPLGQGLAFALGIANGTPTDGVQTLVADITINGALHTIWGTTDIPLNTVHHAALTFDGATTRLFLDGQVEATMSTPGTLTQRAYEDVTIGATGEGLEGNPYEYGLDGSVDSVRLSNVARYTDTFVPPTDKFQPDSATIVLENFDAQQPGLVRAWGGTDPYWIPIRGTGFMAGNSLHNFTVDGGMGIVGFGVWQATIHSIDCLNCDYGFFMAGSSPAVYFDDLLATAGTSRGRYGIVASTNYGGDEFNDIVLDGQEFPFVVGLWGRAAVNRVTINPGENTVFGMIMDRNDPSINGLTIGGGGSAYQAGLLLMGTDARPLIINSNIAGNAGRIRRGGPPAALASTPQPTQSVVPVIVDSWGSADPQAVTPIVQNTTFVNTQGDPEILDINASVSSGSILSGVSSDSSAMLTNDPNAITLPAMSGGPTAQIPPSDPVSTPIADGVIGPGVFDVNAYGAAPNTQVVTPNIDSYPAIQAAVDAACARGGGTVVLSGGMYSLSQPVFVNCNIEIDGPSMRWSRLVAPAGPGLVLNPPGMTGVDLGPALVGSGHSMKTDGGSYWINLRDNSQIELDGKGASTNTAGFTGFTAEAFVEMTSSSPGYAGVVQSAGCLGTPGGSLPGCTSAFQLGTMDGSLYGSMTLGGMSYALQGPALALNVAHHVAVTYDGVQTLRLLLDGHVVQTTTSAMNATIGQHQNEDVTVGPETRGFDGAVQSVAMPGYIDSVRVSRVAEYTGDFAVPTAKLAPDGYTLALVNFDNNVGGCTQGNGYYFPVRRTAEPDGSPEGKISVTLKNFGFNYHGVFGANTENSRYQNVYLEVDDGIVLTGNSSGSVFDNVTLSYGKILAVNSSGSVFHNIWANLSTIPFVLYGGDHIQVNSMTTIPTNASEYGAYFVRSDVTIDGLWVGDGYTASSWKGPAVVDEPTAPFRLYKGIIGGTVQAQGAITVDGGLGYLIEGTSFGTSNVFTDVIHLSAPTSAGALHQAIGIHYPPGSTVSDDPAIQLIGSSSI